VTVTRLVMWLADIGDTFDMLAHGPKF